MVPIRDTIPSRNPPIVVQALILVNVLVFLVEVMLPEARLEQVLDVFGIVPARFTHPEWAAKVGFPDNYWPFLTSMFLHGGWLHLIGNMWILWIFGDNVEDRMGPLRFLGFYILCGLAAGLVHWWTNPSSQLPTVGASGAIAGVMGAYFLWFPHSSVVVMFPIVIIPIFFQVPALVFLGFWLVAQLLSGMGSLASPTGLVGGVAWWAHAGGFVAGMMLAPLFARPKTDRHPWQRDELGVEGAWRPYERLAR